MPVTEHEVKVLTARTKEELEKRINSSISGRRVENISHSHFPNGDGLLYTATILMEKQDGSRQYLTEG